MSRTWANSVNDHPFRAEISKYIWATKYRYREGEVIHDRTITDTWRRIAKALAQAEEADQPEWEDRFYTALKDFKFLPGGRIQAGAGASRQVTLLNCFVMGTIEDSMDGIFDVLKEAALTMQKGGGVGCDFSTLRPKGSSAHTVGGVASGPISFMRIWDAMCATLLSTGNRRGAMMATLRCDHPDIEEFVGVKQDPLQLRNFNLSVLVTDAFMQAVGRGMTPPSVVGFIDGFPQKNFGRRSCGRPMTMPNLVYCSLIALIDSTTFGTKRPLSQPILAEKSRSHPTVLVIWVL